ncbi:MAG: hypothetical protein EOO44_22280, partial [Flavobacterium sp.]
MNKYKLDIEKLKHSPRAVKFWECCLAVFYEKLSSFQSNKPDNTDHETRVNINELTEDEDASTFYLDKAFDYYLIANKHHRSSYEVENNEEYK